MPLQGGGRKKRMAPAPARSGRGDDWVAAAALGSACAGPRAAVPGQEEERGGERGEEEEELEHTWPAWAEAPSSPHFEAAKDALVSLIPAQECALAPGQMPVARILRKEGIEASVELVEAVLAAKRHMTAREARNFPHKFSCVRVADLAHGHLQDEDLLEICCGVFPRLEILKLHGNRLRSLPNLYTLGSHLRMLDLSANGLERLPHNESVWAHFRCLGVLFLHDNQITEPQSLLALVSCHALRHLTLRGNPLAQRERYRGLVLERVPQLSAIDAFVVADMEQHVCKRCSPVHLRAKDSPFATHACGDQLSFTFALPRTFSGGLSYAGAYAISQAITGRSSSTLKSANDRLLWELDTHLHALTRVRRKSSPATSIQCVLRGWLCRRAERRRRGRESGAARRIQALWRGWELRDRLERDAESLLMDLAPNLLLRHDGTRVERHGVAARRRRKGGSEIEDEEEARAEAARRRRLFKGVGSVEQQAAVAIQRVWMKRDVRAHRAASATVLASFFSSVQTYARGATETLRRRGFSGQNVAFLACHRDIDPEVFEAVLKFSCAYALRVADAKIDTGASDTTFAECFLGKSALEVQRGDLEESFSYLSGKRRLETSLQSMHARCASMQAMCARWGDVEAWDATRNRFRRDIRRLEASMAVMQDRLTALNSNPRSLAHTCWSRDARFAKVSRRVAGIRRPPRLDAMLASMQAQGREDVRADADKAQLSRSPLYVLYGPLAQPSVLAWAMHALRALLRRDKVARRLKIINGPLFAAKKSRTQGALVEVYSGENVLREAGVRLAQSVWRAYAARKVHNVHARALLQRGATCIQRAWRSAPFRARMAFVESLAQYLQSLDVMTYRKACYLLPGDTTNGSLNWAKNGAESDDVDEKDADKGSSFRIGQAQEVPTEEANQSPCLFMEESVLRAIRRLKGRKLLRNPSTLMAAQESSLGSECTFSYANHLRLLSARSSPTTLGREVRDSAPESIASSDGEAADFWIRPPPWHRTFLRHGTAHAREGFVEDTLLEQCEGNRPGLLRVGIPDWMQVSPGLLEATQRNAQTSNADLCRIITRGAILTSGELVVPRDGAAGTGKFFEKISMAQRLADSTSIEEPVPASVQDSQISSSVVKTGIVLVRLKFQSHAEARARAAMCFARTWQARTRESLFVVAEHMLGDAYGKTRQNETRVAWGGIPSTYTSIIKRVISQHDRIEENERRARAAQTSSEYAHRASTLQGRRKRRFGRQTGDDDGDEQEEDAVEAWKEKNDDNDDPVSNDEGEDEVAAQLAEQLAALDAFNSTFSIRKGSVRKPQSVLRAGKHHSRRIKPAQVAECGQFLANLDTLPLLAPTGERVGVVASAKGTGRAPLDDAGQGMDGLWPKSSPTSQSQSAEDHYHHHLEDIARAAEMVRIEGLWLDSHLRAADEAKRKRMVRHVKQLREKERARQGVKQARITQHAVHLDRNSFGEPSRPRCNEAPVRIQSRNEDDELGQRVRRGRFLVDRVPRVVTETSDRSFRVKERMMYDEELARMTERREQVQRERARRNAHREEREKSLFQSQVTLSVTKQESRRKARAVICARSEKMQKRVAQVREEDERRRERILHARQTSVQKRQEDSKMGRLFLRMRQTRANAVRQAEERKLRMRVQHEEGLRSIVRALQGQSRPRPPVC